MKSVSRVALVAAALVIAPLLLTAAESAKFRHVVSVYLDDKGGGLKLPEAVACDGKGHLVVGDTGNDRLVRFTVEGKAVTGGTEVKVPELSAPSRLALNSTGDIYALDGKRRRIVHLSPEGEFRNALSYGEVPPPDSVMPKSFALDSADNVYVLDVLSARVVVLDAQGKFVRVLPFPADIGFVSDLAVDPTGTVLLLDSVKRSLYSAAKDATAFETLGKPLTDSLVTLPTAMTTSGGAIFVVEGGGGTIVSYGRDGAFLARQLTPGWAEGSLNHPSQMCINDRDEMFIADRDNGRVQVFGVIR